MSRGNATNLFSALSKYSLSPPENFCTELLAWCLRNSDTFKKDFLKLTPLKLPDNLNGLEIGTQEYWTNKEDDGGEPTSKSRSRGFFDFEIQSAPRPNRIREFLIVIESKIDAPFHIGQLEGYRDELKKRAANYDACFLVTLTKSSKKPPEADAHIKWSQVQELLVKAVVEEKLEVIYKQFAIFLRENGMAPMKIDKINADLKGWCLILQRDLWQILDNLRVSEELKSQLKKNVFEPSTNEPKLWLGIYGKNNAPTWLGFEFYDLNDPSKLRMMVQAKVRGNVRSQDLKGSLGETLRKTTEEHGCAPDNLTSGLEMYGCTAEFDPREGATCLTFSQPIDSEYDGDADRIYEWLLNASKEVSQLKLK